MMPPLMVARRMSSLDQMEILQVGCVAGQGFNEIRWSFSGLLSDAEGGSVEFQRQGWIDFVFF